VRTTIRFSAYLTAMLNERAVEAQLRSSARRRVRPALTILCGALKTAPVRDPFAAAELAIADLVGAPR
jgi:hypothetical protein